MQNLQANPAYKISAAAESYILDLKVSSASPRTIEWYGMLFGGLENWCKGKNVYSIRDVTTELLRAYFLYLEKERWNNKAQKIGLSQRSRAAHMKGLRAWFNYLVREEWLQTNPFENVKPVPMPRDQISPLEEEEINSVLRAIPQKSFWNKRNYLMVWLALDTGLRRSELLGIEEKDINIDARTIRVLGKGNKYRTVPFGLATRKVLVKYLDKVKRMERLTEKIFFTIDGTAMPDRTFNRIIERIGVKAKISRMILSPHKLRHTFAVEYLCNGGDVFSLKDILGHTSIQMTMRYVNFSDSRLKKQSQQFSPGDAYMRKNG
jgi:site-specific recombinase XerD